MYDLRAERLLPERLRELWGAVERGELGAVEGAQEQEGLLGHYRAVWRTALLLDGSDDLEDSAVREIGDCLSTDDPQEVRRRCERAVAAAADDWRRFGSMERYYDESEHQIYDLMWWHTLGSDESPLSHVVALQFALQQGCKSHLDFGSGVGAAAILFATHGFDVALADVSSVLLRYAGCRLARRRISAALIDLKTAPLPASAFDFVTAMDVFEHLSDPVAVVDALWRALRPGGYLFGRFHGEVDPDHPQHILRDFSPTFARLHELGFREVWRDDWLWGHQVFRRA